MIHNFRMLMRRLPPWRSATWRWRVWRTCGWRRWTPWWRSGPCSTPPSPSSTPGSPRTSPPRERTSSPWRRWSPPWASSRTSSSRRRSWWRTYKLYTPPSLPVLYNQCLFKCCSFVPFYYKCFIAWDRHSYWGKNLEISVLGCEHLKHAC